MVDQPAQDEVELSLQWWILIIVLLSYITIILCSVVVDQPAQDEVELSIQWCILIFFFFSYIAFVLLVLCSGGPACTR